ncbi:MAG: hypothetical protein BJ554DRAFT_2027, partial [Olpidium bornovanus]
MNVFAVYLPVGKADPAKIEPLLYHLREVLNNGDEVNYQFHIKHLSQVQKPYVKTDVAIVNWGQKKGAGKHSFWEIIGEYVIGSKHYVYINNIEGLTGQSELSPTGKVTRVDEGKFDRRRSESKRGKAVVVFDLELWSGRDAIYARRAEGRLTAQPYFDVASVDAVHPVLSRAVTTRGSELLRAPDGFVYSEASGLATVEFWGDGLRCVRRRGFCVGQGKKGVAKPKHFEQVDGVAACDPGKQGKRRAQASKIMQDKQNPKMVALLRPVPRIALVSSFMARIDRSPPRAGSDPRSLSACSVTAALRRSWSPLLEP